MHAVIILQGQQTLKGMSYILSDNSLEDCLNNTFLYKFCDCQEKTWMVEY